jgi:hypothetical protein
LEWASLSGVQLLAGSGPCHPDKVRWYGEVPQAVRKSLATFHKESSAWFLSPPPFEASLFKTNRNESNSFNII